MTNVIKFVFLILFSIPCDAYMLSYDDLKLHVHGYAGYKYIHSTAKNTAVESQPELGLELSMDINDNWSVYTQFQYDEIIDDALTYSFITYQNNFSTDDFMLRINAGKLRHDYALYNNTRVNPRSRPGVIVPQSLYWDSLKHILTSGNGVNFNLKFNNLEIGYTIDDPIVTDPVEEANVWTSGLLNRIDTKFGSHQLATIKYTFDEIPLVLKSSWSIVNFGDNSTPLLALVFPDYKDADQTAEFFNAGFIYNYDKWTLSAESIILKPFFTEWFSEMNSYGMSASVNREITDNISVYMNYNQYEAGLPNKYSWFTYAKDINIGLNYHTGDWMVGAEIHKIEGGRWVLPSDFKNNPEDYKNWWMVGVNVVYFF